jgi:hypothetical protein
MRPSLLGRLFDAGPAGEAGVVDECGQAAELALRRGDRPLPLSEVAHVQVHIVHAFAARPGVEAAGKGGALVVTDIGDDDVGAVGDQGLGVRAPEALHASGHDRYLAVQSHGVWPRDRRIVLIFGRPVARSYGRHRQ